MATRPSPRSVRSSRPPASSGGMPVVVKALLGVGGLGVAVLVAALAWPSGPASGPASATAAPVAAPAAAPVAAPAAAPASAPRAGKTPGRAAPPLAAATITKARALLAEAKALSNEGVQARTAGNNELARQKQSAASDKCEAIKAMTSEPWSWLEEAELGNWALSGEYADLGSLYTDLLNLENRIRKGGGTR